MRQPPARRTDLNATLLGTRRLAAELLPGLLRARLDASRGHTHPPTSGRFKTTSQSSYPTLRQGESVQVTPAYRQVVDLADFDRSRFQLSRGGGSSGIPGHPRYDDCIDEYRAGVSRPLLYSRAAVDAASSDTTVILPVGQCE